MSYYFKPENQSEGSKSSASTNKLEKLSELFQSIQSVTAPILRLGRIEQTLNLCESLLVDRSLILSTVQRRRIQTITSKATSTGISTHINHSGIFEKEWYIKKYFQRCLEADENVYAPNGLANASSTIALRSAAAAWEIVEQFSTNWAETRTSKWDTWLERSVGGSSLRQFSEFRKPRHSIYCAIASRLHHDALRASDKKNFTKALSLLAEGEGSCMMAVEMEEALNNNRTPTAPIFTEADDITLSYRILHSTCTATRALEAGHARFSAALSEQAEIFMDNALFALDDYRLALSCATNNDIELEAEAVFYLAKTHHILLKSEIKAHELYIRAVSLVTAISPKLPSGTWFSEAKVAIEARRAKLKAEEDSKWYQRRQNVYDRLANTINEIHRKSSLPVRPLITWIMATHPPKTEGNLPDLERPSSEVSDIRLTLEAVRRYHPDKNSLFGNDWRVLSEEITKVLNGCFEKIKLAASAL